eukprot:5701617-Heterocapsa_arctica.AAC.1
MQHDLTKSTFFGWLLWRAQHGQIQWLLGGPPCGTWSIARFSPYPGPPPVRTRDQPWGFPNLTTGQAKSVRVGTALLMNFIELCYAVAACLGFYILEHPEDPGCAPYPSIWATDPVRELLERTKGTTVGLHQSAFDVESARKAIRLGSNLPSISTLE